MQMYHHLLINDDTISYDDSKDEKIDDHHFSYFISNFICITIFMDVETNTSRENTCSFIFFSCIIAYSYLSEIRIFRTKTFDFIELTFNHLLLVLENFIFNIYTIIIFFKSVFL